LRDNALLPDDAALLQRLCGGYDDVVLRESNRCDSAPDRVHKLIGEPGGGDELQLYRLASKVAPDAVPPFIDAFAVYYQHELTAYKLREFDPHSVLVTAAGKPIDWRRLRVGEERVMRFVEQLFESLAQLHAVGIVHNDIKPANFVEYDGRLRLIDFGHAQLAVSADGRAEARRVLGTEGYQPHEMFEAYLRNYRGDTEPYYCASWAGDMFAAGRALCALIPAVDDELLQHDFDDLVDWLCMCVPIRRPRAAVALQRWREVMQVSVAHTAIPEKSLSLNARSLFSRQRRAKPRRLWRARRRQRRRSTRRRRQTRRRRTTLASRRHRQRHRRRSPISPTHLATDSSRRTACFPRSNIHPHLSIYLFAAVL
jgi:serine/threonine protein kinase